METVLDFWFSGCLQVSLANAHVTVILSWLLSENKKWSPNSLMFQFSLFGFGACLRERKRNSEINLGPNGGCGRLGEPSKRENRPKWAPAGQG